MKASGVHRLLIVNGRGGNYVLSNIVQEASVAGPDLALFPARDDWRAAREAAGCETDNSGDMHPGELETSVLLYASPDLVRPSYATADHEAPSRPHLLTLGMRDYTTSGVIGRPSLATAEKGKTFLDAFVDLAASHLDLLRTTTDDSSDGWPRTE
ncbi:MAG: creatininase family protein [Kineosporiaceae bacterium]